MYQLGSRVSDGYGFEFNDRIEIQLSQIVLSVNNALIQSTSPESTEKWKNIIENLNWQIEIFIFLGMVY